MSSLTIDLLNIINSCCTSENIMKSAIYLLEEYSRKQNHVKVLSKCLLSIFIFVFHCKSVLSCRISSKQSSCLIAKRNATIRSQACSCYIIICKTHNWAGPPNRPIPKTGPIPKTRQKIRCHSHKWAGFPHNWAENTTGSIPTTGLKMLRHSLTNGPILRWQSQ